MRLLVTETETITEFLSSPPPYAILSHRWRDGEVTLQDLSRPDVKSIKGYPKLAKACQTARELGFEYLWMDTCSIDRKSSAELTEFINSVYKWYAEAGICFTYLDDVSSDQKQEYFPKSEWFSRGWTLPELIAPAEVLFFDRSWYFIGTKGSLASDIERITGIDEDVLISGNLDGVSAAKKMSWASKRVTTKVEDEAYCLLGLFDVNMVAIYGERRKAFGRLQDDILKRTNDHSIFAWGNRESFNPNKARSIPNMNGGARVGLMADSPSDFKEAGDVVRAPFHQLEAKMGVESLDTEIMPSSKGIRINFPMQSVKRTSKKYYVAYLACGFERRGRLQLLAIILELLSPHHYARIPGTGSAVLLEIPYDSLITSEVHVDDRAYALRETPCTTRSAISLVLDITSLHVFCQNSDFLILSHFKWTASSNRWIEKPTDLTSCLFEVTTTTADSLCLVLRHKYQRVGLAIVIGIEPSRYTKKERHIFYVDTCPIGKGAGSIPYQRGRDIFQKTLNSWKRNKGFGLARSIASNAALPNGLSIMSIITCDKDPTKTPQTTTNPYSGSSYKLSVRSIKTT